MTTDPQQLQMLDHLKRYGECSTKQIGEHFPEFEDRKALSVFLGNLNREELIVKNNPNRWALTRVGRAVLDKSGAPLGQKADDISEKVTVVADWEKSIRDTSRKAKSDAPVQPVAAFDMARQLQHEIPNGSSLVIESDEVFLVWRGARFAIQEREDLQAFKALQNAYIGEVA